MPLTIFYQHPQRLDETGVVLVPDPAKAPEVKDQLVNRGFLIIKIETPSCATAMYDQSD